MNFTEEMKIRLFDLAHGNLEHDQIIKGFIKHYAINDMVFIESINGSK